MKLLYPVQHVLYSCFFLQILYPARTVHLFSLFFCTMFINSVFLFLLQYPVCTLFCRYSCFSCSSVLLYTVQYTVYSTVCTVYSIFLFLLQYPVCLYVYLDNDILRLPLLLFCSSCIFDAYWVIHECFRPHSLTR